MKTVAAGALGLVALPGLTNTPDGKVLEHRCRFVSTAALQRLADQYGYVLVQAPPDKPTTNKVAPISH